MALPRFQQTNQTSRVEGNPLAAQIIQMPQTPGQHIGAEGIDQPRDPGGPAIVGQAPREQEHPIAGQGERRQNQKIIGRPG